MRNCVDCGVRIGIRATRCKDCRRIHRTKYERERVASQRRPEQPDLGSTEVHGEVIDYTAPGAAARPPHEPDVPEKPKVIRDGDTVVVDYTKGGHSGPGQAQLDLSRVPGEVRRDRVKAEKMARKLAAEENDMSEWDALQAANARMANTVDFSRQAGGLGGLSGGRVVHPVSNPAAAGVLYGDFSGGYEAAAGGRSVRGPQPPAQNSGPQRTPHLIV
jgi:hypothetical protein